MRIVGVSPGRTFLTGRPPGRRPGPGSVGAWPGDLRADRDDLPVSGTSETPAEPASGAPRPSASRRRPAAPRTGTELPGALGWTVLNAILPGTGFLATGRRVLGGVVLSCSCSSRRRDLAGHGRSAPAVRAAADTSSLAWIVVGIGVRAVLWAAVVVAGYLLLVRRGTGRGRRAVGGLVVAALLAAVVVPAVLAGQFALEGRDLIAEVFPDDGQSATVDDEPDPFGDQERVNVLLLGGDGGEGREGVRTDTVIVASIDTETGDTTLFSLPRNLEDLPFPADSPLAEVYPDGFDAATESESLLNAVYRNGPAMHPDILGPTDNPGADFLKLGVGEALGLEHGLLRAGQPRGLQPAGRRARRHHRERQLLRADRRRPDEAHPAGRLHPPGAEPGAGRLHRAGVRPRPVRPHRLRPDGPAALHDRRDRRRRRPITLLQQVPGDRPTTRDIVITDIPRSALDDFVDLASSSRTPSIRSVVFDNSVISPAYPDYDLIRGIVTAGAGPDPDRRSDDGDEPAGGAVPATTRSPTPPPRRPTPGRQRPRAADEELAEFVSPTIADACAYDREQAGLALAAGKPPTANG